jgi:hypothetical protein
LEAAYYPLSRAFEVVVPESSTGVPAVLNTRRILEEQAEMPRTGMGHANFEEWFPLSVPEISPKNGPWGMGGATVRKQSQ